MGDADGEHALRVLTLNCWGVPGTQSRAKRMAAIGIALRHRAFDVVCLQEVWLASDVERVVEFASPALPYSHWFRGGFVGSGLLTLSRHPIVATSFHRYTLNGTPWDVAGADWFGAKGVGLVRVALPRDEGGGTADVYNTHLIARYDGWAKGAVEDYRAHRLAQALELASFVACVSGGGPAVVVAVAGDLNATADQWVLRVLRAVAGLRDAHVGEGDASEGATCCGDNTWAHAEDAACPRRLDYVLYMHPRGRVQSGAQVCMRCVGEDGSSPGETDAAAGFLPLGTSFSDHFGVVATVGVASPCLARSAAEAYDEGIEEVTSTLRSAFDVGLRLASERRLRHAGHAAAGVAAWLACLLTQALHATPLALGILSFGAAGYATVHVLVAVLHGLDERNGLLHAAAHALRLPDAHAGRLPPPSTLTP